MVDGHSVEGAHRSARQQRDRQDEHAHRDEGAAGPEQGDDQRTDERADGQPREVHALLDGQDAREHVVVRGALEQGSGRHDDHRHPDPDEDQHDHGRGKGSEKGHRRLRQPEHQSACEHDGGQRAALGQPGQGDASQRDANPVGPRQQSRRRLRQPEDLVVERDRQRLVGPLKDRHAGHEQQQRQRAGAAAQGGDALESGPQLPGRVSVRRPDDRRVHAGGQERGDDPEDGAEGQHDPGAELVGENSGDDEPDEDRRTVHERGPPVGRHEVSGAPREQGQGREVRRPYGEDRNRGGGPADEHDPERCLKEQHDRGESRAHSDARVRQRQGAPPGQSVEVAREHRDQHDGRQLHGERRDPDERGAALGVGDQQDRQPPGELGEPAEPIGDQDATQPRIAGQGEQRCHPGPGHLCPFP